MSKTPQTTKLMHDALADYLTLMARRQNGEVHFVETGLSALDEKFHGAIHEGHLIVIAARPAMGKTALAQQITEIIAESGNRSVLFFSLEMNANEVVERSLSRNAKISIGSLKTVVNLGANQYERLAEAVKRTTDLPFIIEDSTYSINAIVGKTKAVIAELSKRNMPPLGVVVVDYIQLVTGKGQNRTQEVGNVTTLLKRMAKELGLAVIAISQLNRGVEGRNDKRPSMSDLRESGQIEQDADLILFVYRDEVYDEHSQDKGVAEIIAGKNRHGPLGKVRLAWDGKYVTFGDLDE